MSPLRLWWCVTGSCPVLLYRTGDGLCRRCGKQGQPIDVLQFNDKRREDDR